MPHSERHEELVALQVLGLLNAEEAGDLESHLEEGCRVGAQIEVMMVRFKGPAMTRKAAAPGGPSALQPK